MVIRVPVYLVTLVPQVTLVSPVTLDILASPVTQVIPAVQVILDSQANQDFLA